MQTTITPLNKFNKTMKGAY